MRGWMQNIFKGSATFAKKAWKNTSNTITSRMNTNTTQKMMMSSAAKTKSLFNNTTTGLKKSMSYINSKVVDNRFAGASRNLTRHTTSDLMGNTLRKKAIGYLRKGTHLGAIGVASAALAGTAFMNGAMSQAQDIMYSRYLRDAKYSSRLLTRTNIGKSAGNSALNRNNTVGLSLAMHRNRH